MSDSLKDKVDRSREDFEVYDFNIEAGWDHVKEHVATNSKERWSWQKVAGVAACFLFLTLSTLHFISQDGIDHELSEVERYYSTEINQKVTLVRSQLGDAEILEDLAAMDQAFAELKADLQDNVDNEEVIAAMMENYQLKLQILEEILNELEKENREKFN